MSGCQPLNYFYGVEYRMSVPPRQRLLRCPRSAWDNRRQPVLAAALGCPRGRPGPARLRVVECSGDADVRADDQSRHNNVK